MKSNFTTNGFYPYSNSNSNYIRCEMTEPIPKENERFLIPYFLDRKNIEMSKIPWPTTEIDWIYSCQHTRKSLLEAVYINKEENKYFDFEVDEEFDFWFVIKQL